MHVSHVGPLGSERCVQRAVEKRVLKDLVEPHDDVERGETIRGAAPRLLQIARERARRHREIPHTSLDEVSSERRFGEVKHLRPRPHRIDLREHLAEPREIGGVVALGRLELSDGEMDEWGHIVKMSLRNAQGQPSGVNCKDVR